MPGKGSTRRTWVVAVVGILTLVAPACGRGKEKTIPETVTVSTTTPIRTPDQYLGYALDLIADNAYYWRRVDWPTVRAEAFRRAAGAVSFGDTYDAISYAIGQLGDRHSVLETPGDSRAEVPDPIPLGLPEAVPLAGRMARLRLPPIAGPTTTPEFRRYVEAAERAVRSQPDACGWMVDLRDNNGGNMLAMLSAVGPMLGEGDAIRIRNGRGITQRFSYKDGEIRFDGKLAPGRKNNVPLRSPLPPVALITDHVTASSAEFIVLAFRGRADSRSFGEKTAGVPTANDQFRLPDGAIIRLTIAVGADRDGKLFEGPITPDEEVVPADTLAAAGRWLRETDACRPRTTTTTR
jgi:carboxyl-terminal processing protease